MGSRDYPMDIQASPLSTTTPRDSFVPDPGPSHAMPYQQIRALTESNLHESQSIDSEFLGAGPAQHGGFNLTIDSEHPPVFHRTFSAPLPERVGSLRHPLSPSSDPLGSHSAHPPLMQSFSSLGVLQRPDTSSFPSETTLVSSSESPSSTDIQTPLQSLSVELADSLQSVIQTLLHLSPPHLLDNAKEQYSGCTVQMPTTSLSALLTSMRTLNYLSANVQTLTQPHFVDEKALGLPGKGSSASPFDIGELLQNVADLLGGQASYAGVDLVLFYGDVTFQHKSVLGDAEGLGYVLSHVSLSSRGWGPLIYRSYGN